MDPQPLASAAFGPEPGQWPLPPAASATELWLRAVAAGGQGRYASARADLADLTRRRPVPRLASLALSTQGSLLRQLGGHTRAAGWDGRAWALAGADPEAGIDALAGLAADALGAGRLAVAAALLERAVDLLRAAGAGHPRPAVRLAWVHAELAMAAGEGREAVTHAERAAALAGSALPSLVRHRVKSDLVLAAALACAGDRPGARRVADMVLVDTATHRLIPLRWAAACLLAGTGSDTRSPAEITVIRQDSAAFMTRHGGRWRVG